jgi:superoxide reductase
VIELEVRARDAGRRSGEEALVIEGPSLVRANEPFEVRVTVVRGTPYADDAGHHIEWVSLYFEPEGEKYPTLVGNVEFDNRNVRSPLPGREPLCDRRTTVFSMRTRKRGILRAVSFCSGRGLFESSRDVGLL